MISSRNKLLNCYHEGYPYPLISCLLGRLPCGQVGLNDISTWSFQHDLFEKQTPKLLNFFFRLRLSCIVSIQNCLIDSLSPYSQFTNYNYRFNIYWNSFTESSFANKPAVWKHSFFTFILGTSPSSFIFNKTTSVWPTYRLSSFLYGFICWVFTFWCSQHLPSATWLSQLIKAVYS